MNNSPEPIDLVYTWVDGSDPAWQERKRLRQLACGLPASNHSTLPHRYTNHDELLYSLRSVEKFMPWVRRVHLVTDRQKPAWLNTAHPKLRLVDHTQLFAEPSHLPTFSANAIEANLHRIPDIADRFLYLNDDMMVGRPFSPSDFFAPDGRPYSIIFPRADHSVLNWFVRHFSPLIRPLQLARLDWWVKHRGPRRTPFNASLRYNRLQIGRRLRKAVPFHKTQHTPLPHTRAQMDEVARVFAAELALCSSHPFRAPDDPYFPDLYALHGLMTGSTLPAPYRRGDLFYFHLGRDEPSKLRALRAGRYAFVCISDSVGEVDEATRVALEQTLGAFLPEPSSFELPRGAGAGGAAARDSV